MNCHLQQIWTRLAVLTNILKLVNVQFAMPMFPPPPPIFPMPAPMPFMPPVMYPLQAELMSSTTSSPPSTTNPTAAPSESENIAVGVPIPMPMPMPMHMPMPMPMPLPMGMPACVPPPPQPPVQQPDYQRPPPRPKECPPCPPCICTPSCTPSFFAHCSPCHMKCRCRDRNDAPQPMHKGAMFAIPAPPQVLVVPFPPPINIPVHKPIRRPRKRPKQIYSSCSDESSDTSSSESDFGRVRKGRYGKRKRYGIVRRSLHSTESENELVKPMLSYISENGDVKFKTKISNDEVAELLGEKKIKQETIQVFTAKDDNNKPKVVVMSKYDNGNRRAEIHKKVLLRGGVTNHVLGNGKKELVFKPPGGKTISNLSVSFQIS